MTARKLLFAGTVSAGVLAAMPAMAQVSTETAFIFNTFSYLVCGFLVMFMAAGFCMLEAGLVRSKNSAAICLKNIALYSTAGIMFYLIGYNMLYGGASPYFGGFSLFYDTSPEELALIAGDGGTAGVIGLEYNNSVMSDWFFQMVFVAATASIVSGTVAERVKFWPFIIFTVVLAGIIYPVTASWTWGGGWLSDMGFSDFAGSTIVHSVGGWAALAGAIVIGARKGKFGADGSINPLPGANLPLATLGTFILWLGWFGFNGGSQLALGSALDAVAMSNVFINTNLAAAAGVLVAAGLTQILYKKVDLTMALNGALGGLVSITAGPDVSMGLTAMIVGGIGGALVVIAVPLLDKMKIDDVVGAISVHLVCGIWGTLAVAIFGAGDFVVQIIGIVAIGAATFISAFIVWTILKVTIGVRVSEEDEIAGIDKSELGLEAYPEFGSGSARV